MQSVQFSSSLNNGRQVQHLEYNRNLNWSWPASHPQHPHNKHWYPHSITMKQKLMTKMELQELYSTWIVHHSKKKKPQKTLHNFILYIQETGWGRGAQSRISLKSIGYIISLTVSQLLSNGRGKRGHLMDEPQKEEKITFFMVSHWSLCKNCEPPTPPTSYRLYLKSST